MDRAEYEGRFPVLSQQLATYFARKQSVDSPSEITQTLPGIPDLESDSKPPSHKPDSLLQRFKREAKVVSRLNHPNIVAAYDADDVEGVPYLALEFVDGPDLSDLDLERGFGLPIDRQTARRMSPPLRRMTKTTRRMATALATTTR